MAVCLSAFAKKIGPRFRLFSTPTGVLASPFRGVVPIPDAARKHGVGPEKTPHPLIA